MSFLKIACMPGTEQYTKFHSNGKGIKQSGANAARKLARFPIQAIARGDYLYAKKICRVVNLFSENKHFDTSTASCFTIATVPGTNHL